MSLVGRFSKLMRKFTSLEKKGNTVAACGNTLSTDSAPPTRVQCVRSNFGTALFILTISVFYIGAEDAVAADKTLLEPGPSGYSLMEHVSKPTDIGRFLEGSRVGMRGGNFRDDVLPDQWRNEKLIPNSIHNINLAEGEPEKCTCKLPGTGTTCITATVCTKEGGVCGGGC